MNKTMITTSIPSPNSYPLKIQSQIKPRVPTMQSTKMEHKTTESHCLKGKKVKDLIKDSKRLVEVPYTASLADTMNALVANRVGGVPVAAPPGHWIGAGGSMILESDRQTGAVRKHYIGMVTMLDILAHIAENGGDLDQKMHVPVSTIIGHCLESLSLWTLNSNTSIQDCMEVFSKGIHRALVPLDSHVENVSGVELMESASSYRMLTQMDVLKFLKEHAIELRGILSRQVRELGAVSDIVFGVTSRTKVIDAIKCMNTAALNAVPIVEFNEDIEEEDGQLINGKDRKLVGTFSATDLRGCSIPQLQSCMHLNVVDFIEQCSGTSIHQASGLNTSTRNLITCLPESTLGEVVDKCVNNHVHRVWVVDGPAGLLCGLISHTDIIRVARASMLLEPA